MPIVVVVAIERKVSKQLIELNAKLAKLVVGSAYTASDLTTNLERNMM